MDEARLHKVCQWLCYLLGLIKQKMLAFASIRCIQVLGGVVM